jgi:hypothetical protein
MKSNPWLQVVGLLLGCVALELSTAAYSQTPFGLSVEVRSSTRGLDNDSAGIPPFSPLAGAKRNLDVAGKPCIDVFARSDKQIINSSIYNQILTVSNHCSMQIKIRACYYKSERCMELTADPNMRREHVFGVDTSPEFRFSFREYVR